MFDKKDVDHEFDIDRTLYRFYNEDAVKHAKLELWKHYKDNLPKWEDRKNTTKTCKEKEIKDILQGVKAIDEAFSGEDELPVIFAAVRFCNVPSDRFTAESDVRDRLRTLEIQMAQLMNSKTNYAQVVKSNTTTVTSTRQKKKDNHQCNQPATNGQNSLTNDDAHAAHEAPIVTLLNHDELGDNPDNDGQHWQTVKNNGGRGRRRHSDTVYGNTADDVIKMGKKKQELFVFRVDKNVTDEQFRDYISRKDNIDCVKVKRLSHEDAASNSYHVIIHTMDTKVVMSPEFWPEGVGCRRYIRRQNQDFTSV